MLKRKNAHAWQPKLVNGAERPMEDDSKILNLGMMFLLLLSTLVSTYFVFLLGSVKENLESAVGCSEKGIRVGMEGRHGLCILL